ncbi:MAG TPA: translation initiation factor IF-2 [Blastocatellia bacterium]|nr:translation initiation factor IF-2 [Blastocatellia bacterium]
MGKVRIYELARELKLESRQIIEHARRLGVDVSVPSNSLDEPIAERIREIYFPRKEQTVTHRAARLVKHARPQTQEAASPAAEAPVTSAPPEATAPAQPAEPAQPAPSKPRLVKIVPPPAPAEVEAPAEPEPAAGAAPEEPVAEPAAVEEVAAQAPAEPAAAEPEPAPAPEEPKPVIREIRPTVTPPVQPAPELVSAPPVSVPPAAQEPVRPVPAPPQHRTAPPARPATTTNVIRLATPTKPLPKPQPVRPAPQPVPARPAPGKTGAPAQPAAKGKEEVHLLPSGAVQRTTYVPPKDNRHKGRHARPRGGVADKQEGHQRILPQKRPVAVSSRALPVELKSVRLVEGSTVREFAEKIEVAPKEVVAELFNRGVMATINQTLNPDVAKEIGRVFGYDVSFGAFEDMIIESEFEITPEAMEDTDPRAPVITVMGHVDHGKTSLLDTIRSTRVAEGEAGGITQHIGAYSVEVPNPDNHSELRRVVFLDTPGHEAFTMMRARGAKVTDIVILVVAADDGVMPQTVEAIEHSRAAGVPIIVAINKIDKPDANPERVKKELADRGLLWDGWGGDTTMVEVSARKNQNIDTLLELILLQADLMDLKANPKRMATGTVLEAKLDRGRGAVATVLIQNGTLRVGEPFIVGNFFGKVRALMDHRGQRIQEAGPATPVEILGLEGVPAAGDQFQVVADVAKAQQISSYRQSKARMSALARTAARGLDQLAAQMESGEVKELLVILKADVQGSVEVLKDTLTRLSTEKVKVRIIRSAVGAITYDDVLLASASNATSTGAATVIIGFNVRPEARASEAARQENVDIRLHSIIYKVEEEIRNAMIGMLDATLKERVLGKAEVRDVIRVPKVGSVAGCYVLEGSIKRTARARLIRDNVVIFESSIGSLRRFKDDVSEVQQGYECGITIERFNDYKIGDQIEAFVEEKVAATQL